MESTSIIALSRQMAVQRQMDVIANNLANASTPAYRSERMLFTEYLRESDDGHQYSYVQDLSLVRNLQEGQRITTDNDLDLAIAGEGYFQVDTDMGIRYTRSGSFTLNSDAEIVTSQGYNLLDEGGSSITVPISSGRVNVTRDGVISGEHGRIARLQILKFESEHKLVKQRDSLYDPSGMEPEIADEAEILQGQIEGSNVQAITEMTEMIKANRAYQASAKFIAAVQALP